MKSIDKGNFTSGKILRPLISFTLPVLFALFLQAMYGAVDLAVVGWFGTTSDVSAVSTGSQIMQTITVVVAGLSMGTTVLLGQKLGEGKGEEAGAVIGSSVCLFAVIALVVTAVMQFAAEPFANFMNAPETALSQTVSYIRICSGGALFIVAYNMVGSVFRGIGDSKTPLIAVAVACVLNIAGDLLFVAVFEMGAAGAALATVISQAVSVVICLAVIAKKGLPFSFSRKNVRFNASVIRRVLGLGWPIALQDALVSASFLAILSIVNSLGETASAGMGVSEKICAFVMLVPSAFMQSLSAFVAQNYGAGKHSRAQKAMLCGMAVSLAFGAVISVLAFFRGDLLASLFAPDDAAVISAAADYLAAYAIDTVFVSLLFCFIGFFNGCGRTGFSMVQGIIGAFCVRIPVSFFMSRIEPVSLFRVGLATPCSTVVQIVLCTVYFLMLRKKLSKNSKRPPETEISDGI